MKPLRRAAARLCDAGSIPVLAALLALAVSAPLAAGEHSRPHDSSDQGRSAQPRSDSGSRPSSPPPSSGGSSGGSSGWGSPSSSGQEPRVAVPRSESNDDSHQQRPQTGSRGGYHGGGWNGGGGYYGGYYSPYNRYYWGPYWGWGWWGWWGGDDYYGYYPGYNYPRYYGDRYDRETGALDIDVSPGKTEVWIDGRYVGTADDFDGFPQYLWLDKGVYDLVLYREGYTTIARQITVHGGSVVSIDDRMQRGESVKPQDLATKTHERRNERVRSEDERREELARRDQANMEDWRERARRRIEDRDRYDRGDRGDQNGRDEAVADGGAHLHLQILPSDASVYLDGRFIGTGVDLERLRQGVRVEPGEHRIAVVRPGHKAEEQQFTAAAGEDVDLNIELESME